MARHDRFPRARGFSLVEMLVALLFTGLLMAGMAQVFKSSLGSFSASGEILSAARRNRASLDMLYDDLNSAGMYLRDLALAPKFTTANPGFQILPNQPVAGVGPDGPATADELFFVFDQPLPFIGTLEDPSAAKDANRLVDIAGDGMSAVNNTYTVDCLDESYANLVQPGMWFIIRDKGFARHIVSRSVSGRYVTVTGGADAGAGVSGKGDTGYARRESHFTGSGVMFFLPMQMVRYSIKMKNLDPQQPAGVPCLVRDQGNYSEAGFAPIPALESVITENLSGFKVFLSADSGQNWVGEGSAATSWSSLLTLLDAQLATSGQQGFTSTKKDEHNWFRATPVLVRLDIATRTTMKRGEFSSNPATPAYKDVTQSLVIVPRHFGLALN